MRRWVAVCVVVAVTLAVWARVIGYDWALTWDDAVWFAGNPKLTAWSWRWMATTQMAGHWMPLTWLSATLTYALWGWHPGAWHAVNVGIHTISAVLFFCIARRLVGSDLGALVAALVFSIHPLRMESVAWISERKDVLMGVFVLSAALLWLQNRRGWALAAFVAACLSKSLAVVLPAMLLALDWYLGARFVRSGGVATSRGATMIGPYPLSWSRVRLLLPFFAVSAGISAIAFVGIRTVPASLSWTTLPLTPRLLNVAYGDVFYAMQTVWPARLSNLIELTWAPSWSQPQYPVAVGVCAVMSGLLLLTWRRWPALTAATVAYAVAVFPQAGLFQNGPQLVANRYSYLACLPLALLAGASVTWAARRWARAAVFCSAAVVAALAITTSLALPMWRNGDTLWTYAALHEPTCTQCQDMATGADMRRGDVASAIRHQQQAIRVSATTYMPRWERHWNLAGLWVHQGQREDAMQELRIYLAAVPPARRETEPDRAHYAHALDLLAALEAGRL